MRLIDADAFDKYLEQAEIEATKSRKYVFRSAINTIRGNLANFPTVNQWIPCSERFPEERDSIFAKLYGTEKWRDAMFRKTSNTVIITVEFKDGTRQTAPCHTIDGEWNQSMKGMGKVLAWCPLPEPYKEKE